MTLYLVPWEKLSRFSRQQRRNIVRLLAARIRSLDPTQYSERKAVIGTIHGPVTITAITRTA